MIKQLHEIRRRGEKALVFARLTDMQQLLAAVLQEEFGLCVRIVNGTTPRDRNNTGTTARARETRSKMLEEFRTKPGFHVIILSPFVAGIGLTLTEANHVIHYGRWWNPAIEAQATDRAYRIGQEKPVTVHLPILSDPSRRIEMSFDECLHRMLQQKESLARDFLQPMPGEDKLAEELRNTLVGGRQDQAEPVDPNSVGQLSPSDFEALVGCLFRHKGYQVVLTSRSSDGGADVVAVKDQEVVLIQAKHTSKFHTVSAEAVGDILGAQSIYQSRMQRRFRLKVVSNGFFDSGCTAKARQHGVTLIDGKALRQMIEDAKVSLGEIAAMNGERATSFADGVRRINAL
ncbi:MAG: restriction endonuclease [Bryobacterales bacterium]|nr:restriction endonuclease [Bryobacterales bacterium]